MSDFQRYAIYYLPEDPALAQFGATWLGWDLDSGRVCRQFKIDGIAEATEAPRKYGFHGTLKSPFRLVEGANADDLATDLRAFAAARPAVLLDGLSLACIGQFLALVPKGETRSLAELAFACVSEFDLHRRPADAGELARRRLSGLTARQDALLTEWGYPYVADEFRFHLTLTGKLEKSAQDTLIVAASDAMPTLPAPFAINSIALVGEGEDRRFRLIDRYPLTG